MRLLLIAFIAAWIGAQMSAGRPDRADANLIQQLKLEETQLDKDIEEITRYLEQNGHEITVSESQ